MVPIRAASRVKPSHAERITLIGDAVHTMPPFGAHGANTGLKDAQTLVTQLSRQPTFKEAIAAYESEMSCYSRPLVRSALRMMTMATADFPLKRPIFRTVVRVASLFSQS